MTNICKFCGNKHLSQKNVQYIYRQKAQLFVVNDVPCIQCDYCGEQYFEAKVLKQIETAFLDIKSQKRQVTTFIEAPVENYTSI